MVGRERRLIEPTQKSIELRELIRVTTIKSADALLLSGGIDSSALAAMAPKVPAYTTSLEGTRLDIKFAGMVARHLKLDWHPVVVSKEEAIFNLKETITVAERYDTALLNDVALYIAMKRAIADVGARRTRSGEEADTLFRGYYHTYDGEDTAKELNARPNRPALPLDKIESKLGIIIDYPYLDKDIKELAKTLSREDNILLQKTPGAFLDKPPGKGTLESPLYVLGKVTLRQSMIGVLPYSIVSRPKTEIEFGSGMNSLTAYLRKIGTPELREELEDVKGMHFRSAAHVGLYVLFTEAGLKIRPPKEGEYGCTWCGSGVQIGIKHCYTCGAWPSNTEPWRFNA